MRVVLNAYDGRAGLCGYVHIHTHTHISTGGGGYQDLVRVTTTDLHESAGLRGYQFTHTCTIGLRGYVKFSIIHTFAWLCAI